MNTEVAIIGAGVVGAAIAERLARGGRHVVVLEQHPRAGQVTSSRNSQVLHSGLYYPHGSLKARLCVAGNRSLANWCSAHRVPLRRVGKLVVATVKDEEPELHRLLKQGRANGVEGLALVDPHECEPSIAATAGLYSPHTGILDAHALVDSLVRAAVDHGATFAWRHRCLGLLPGHALELLLPDGSKEVLRAEQVVNAAGLQADEVAALAGIDLDAAGYRQHWVKGHYFRVGPRRPPLSHLIYPVPAPQLAGLGVHLTLGLDGDVRLGPDVLPLPERTEDYEVPEARGDQFFQAARRYLPWLQRDWLSPDTAGIRPKLSAAGEPWRDFVIAEESARELPGLVNLLGIESPGLTCCLEIADEVARLLG